MSLQEVENAIRVMNQAAFQELGDLLGPDLNDFFDERSE